VVNRSQPSLLKNGPPTSWQPTCDKASPATAVMLHLRSCYVSKAAILTVPAHPVPVENRSPRLDSKGLDR
jgi:hypothetical protein